MGWIKLDRKLLDNKVWKGDVFSRGQAWVDLLLTAAFDEQKDFTGAHLTVVPRGCVRTSIRDLADRWGWGKKKVCNFLSVLEEDHMVVRNGDTKGTLLTIVNYDKFQLCGDTEGDTEETRRRHEGDTGRKKDREEAEKEEKKQKKNKGEEEKKESIQEGKEIKNIYNPPNKFPPSVQDVADYVREKGYKDVSPEYFVDFYESKGWMVGKNRMKDWKAAVRGWHSRNGKDGHGLANVRGRGASFFDLLEDDEL